MHSRVRSLRIPRTHHAGRRRVTAPAGTAFKPFVPPVIVPPAADDTTATEDTYYEDSRKLRDYIAMESTLKQQLLAAVKTTYDSR